MKKLLQWYNPDFLFDSAAQFWFEFGSPPMFVQGLIQLCIIKILVPGMCTPLPGDSSSASFECTGYDIPGYPVSRNWILQDSKDDFGWYESVLAYVKCQEGKKCCKCPKTLGCFKTLLEKRGTLVKSWKYLLEGLFQAQWKCHRPTPGVWTCRSFSGHSMIIILWYGPNAITVLSKFHHIIQVPG